MSAAIRAYLDTLAGTTQDPEPVLYVERDERGPLLVITPGGEVGERHRLPESAWELVDPADTLADVSAALFKALAAVKTPRAVREAIGKTLRELGLDGDAAEEWMP